MRPDILLPCMWRSDCGDPEITAWTDPGPKALWFNLGENVDLQTFDSARLEMNRDLMNMGGGDTTDAAHRVNQRRDGMAPRGLDDLEIYAGTTL
jgi:hypothetical protein